MFAILRFKYLGKCITNMQYINFFNQVFFTRIFISDPDGNSTYPAFIPSCWIIGAVKLIFEDGAAIEIN